MMLRVSIAAVLGCGLAAAAAEAAPATQGLGLDVPQASAVEKIAQRGCFWRNGRKYCAPVAARRYRGYAGNGSGYYEQDASRLPVGSSRWWYVKDREGSTGRP